MFAGHLSQISGGTHGIAGIATTFCLVKLGITLPAFQNAEETISCFATDDAKAAKSLADPREMQGPMDTPGTHSNVPRPLGNRKGNGAYA